MSNRVIIDQTTNTVSTDQCPEIHNSVVVNNDVPSTIDVIENITNIVTVTVPGPQGSQGLIGPSGSQGPAGPSGSQGPAGPGADITGSQYYVPLFKNATGLVTSSIYQSGSFTSIRNATSPEDPANPDILYVNGDGVDTYNLISAHGNKNSYLQINVQNYNGSTEASSDIVATADNGTESENYINMGINSSGFTNTGNVGGQNDAYLYSTGNDLYIGNASPGKQIIIFNGGLDAANQAKVWIHDQGTVGINTDTYNTTNPPSLQVNAPNDTTYNIAQFFGNTDNYAQVGITNANIGTTASADLVLYNNIDYENQLAGFVDLGINSTNYVYNGVYPGSAGDAYLFTDSEHLVIGSVSGSGAAKITLFAGGISESDNAKLVLYGNNKHQMTGSLSATEGFSGSLFGTASWALNAFTASFVPGYVSGSGENGQISFWTGSNIQTGSSNLVWDNSNAYLYIGTSGSSYAFGHKIRAVGQADASIGIFRNQASASPSKLEFFKSRGTYAVPVANNANDQIFNIGGFGWGTASTQYVNVVNITAIAESIGANGVQGRLNFTTFNSSSGNLATMALRNSAPAPGSGGTVSIAGDNVSSITNPQGTLHIRGFDNTSANNSLYIDSFSGTQLLKLSNDGQFLVGAGSFTGQRLQISGDTFISSSGDSTDALQISNRGYITFRDNTGTVTSRFRGISGGFQFQDASFNIKSQISTTNSVTFFNNGGGNVGIATTAPSYSLDVSGSGRYTNGLTVSSSLIAPSITGSLQGTASWALNALTASFGGNFTASNALINGTITAQTLVVQTITSSVDFVTGSTRFGSLLTNTHQFTGSVSVTGSLTVVGRTTINDLTGSLFGTSSWALNSLTASYVSSSNVVGTVTSASYALTASYALNAGVAGAAFPFTGSALITGSLGVTGSVAITGSLNVGSSNIEYQENTNVTTGTWRVVSSEPTASYRAAFFDYVMFSGSVARAGTVYSVWSASYAEYYENYTGDVGGSTSGVTLQAAISGSNIQLQATSSNNSWTIRSLVRML